MRQSTGDLFRGHAQTPSFDDRSNRRAGTENDRLAGENLIVLNDVSVSRCRRHFAPRQIITYQRNAEKLLLSRGCQGSMADGGWMQMRNFGESDDLRRGNQFDISAVKLGQEFLEGSDGGGVRVAYGKGHAFQFDLVTEFSRSEE